MSNRVSHYVTRPTGKVSLALAVFALSIGQGNVGHAQQSSIVPALGVIDSSTADGVDQNEFVLDAPADRIQAVAARHGLTIVRSVDARSHKVFLVTGPGTASGAELANAVAADPDVTHFEKNGIAITPEVPSGINLDQSSVYILEALSSDRTLVNFFGAQAWSQYAKQPATNAIRLAQAHAKFLTGAQVVAIIDTGVDPNHPLLRDSLVPGYDFVNETSGAASDWDDLDPATRTALDQSSVYILEQASVVSVNQSTVAVFGEATAASVDPAAIPPAFGHGTMVAGLIHLVAPTAKIMPLRVFRADGSSRVFDIARAIYYAVENGARVINMSFSTAELSPEITHAINHATEQGVICVSSAGNSGRDLVVYPAGLRSVAGIGSTNAAEPARRSLFSNYGSSLIEVGAPGEGVLTTYPGGHYVGAWGTSFSTGLVSGAVALLLQRDPTLWPSRVFDLLEDGDSTSGSGGMKRLNLLEMLEDVVDRIAPTVAVVSPASGTVVGNTVLISASASDNVKVAGVKFLVNNVLLGAEDTVAPFEATWNTAGIANGSHTLTVIARDLAGNATSATLTITTKNDLSAPTVRLTSPATGATVSGSVTLTATASDDSGVAGVQFLLDGVALGAMDSDAPYELAWSTVTVTNGAHALTAIARDTAGKETTAASVGVTVANDTTAPLVALTNPVAGATISGTVTVAASATDDGAVTSVQFLLDGVALAAADTQAPYEVSWSTSAVANGAHTITAIARDAAGNEATAANVLVTVANDTAAPTVALIGLTSGAALSGTVTLVATAADDGSVASVQFMVDGVAFGAIDTDAPYELAWSTRAVSNGVHTVTATARDAAGNESTTAAVPVTVANDITAPTVGLMGLTAGTTVTGTVTLMATATDDGSVASVQFLVDGTAFGAVDTEAPYELAWSTLQVPNGPHVVTAVARDAAGNETTAANVTVTVANDTTAPTVGLTGLTAGATLTGTVTLAATATDDGSVASVQFLVDGAAFGAVDTDAPYELALSTLQLPNGAHTLTAVARDAAGNEATAAAVSVNVFNDTTAPAVAVTGLTAGATVTGTLTIAASATDDDAVASVQFLLDGVPLGATDTAAPYELAWSTLTAANGAHTVAAVARDAAGNEATAAAVSVNVFNDTTAPTVALTGLAAGATVTGTVTVVASATDDDTVASVQFLLDGAPLGATDTAAPYELAWSTLTVANGPHSVTAVARDAAGNETTAAAITVAVFNDTTAPTVLVTSPTLGTTASGTVTLTANATDDGEVAGVQFLLDGVALGATDTAAPYEVAWSTLTATNGTHILTAVARDAAGNEGTAAAVTVTVFNDTTAPTVLVTSPATGTMATGTVTFTATATDDGGVASVQFLLDGVVLGSADTEAPYELAWSSLAVANGVHALTAVARDAVGNEAVSASISLTVANDVTPPVVALTGLTADATVVGTVTLAATATDDGAIASVRFLVDGVPLAEADSEAPYAVTWSTLGVPTGPHTVTAIARDAAGNEAAAAVTVMVAAALPDGGGN